MASVVLGTAGFPWGKSLSTDGPNWGSVKPRAMVEDSPKSAYLTGLADSAEECFHRQIGDARALARQIGESRQSWSTLILTDHRPLSAEDRAWLVEKYRSWAAKFDAGKGPSRFRDRGSSPA